MASFDVTGRREDENLFGSGYDYGQDLPKATGSGEASSYPIDTLPKATFADTGRSQAIENYYQTYLGRTGGATDRGPADPGYTNYVNSGLDLPAIETSIKGSPEAQAFAKTKGTGAWQDWVRQAYQQTRGRDPTPDELAPWEGYWNAWGKNDPEYFKDRLFNPQKYGGDQYGQSVGGSTYGAGSTFSDPATAEWEKALRTLTDRLNTPYQNPDLSPLLSYLRDYATKLQGPAYTPQQMDLLQTQALDPLTQQRDAERKRLTENLARRGLTPDSGIAQSQQNDLERQFQQLRSQREGQFASNAVNLDRQNQQLAAQVLAQVAGLQAQDFQGNENRALQALGLLGQIPQLADRRLALAMQSMQPQQINPVSLLSQLGTFQNQGLYQQQQDANFWNNIGQALAGLFL